MKEDSYLIIGGDKRQEYLYNLLKKKNIKVDRIFFNDTDSIYKSIEKISKANVIILPIPSTKDGENLNAPFSKKIISLQLIADNIPKNAILFLGGKNQMLNQVKTEKTIDLLSEETLTIKNAMATAEATLAVIIENTTKTIFGSKILITGYGRIGKILSDYLLALKANVTICARKESARTYAELSGANALELENLKSKLADFDVIINTAPTLLFNKEELEIIKNEALIIDLASKPGGIDFETAKKLGLNVIHALSLPGIYSPETAAEFIEQTVLSKIT